MAGLAPKPTTPGLGGSWGLLQNVGVGSHPTLHEMSGHHPWNSGRGPGPGTTGWDNSANDFPPQAQTLSVSLHGHLDPCLWSGLGQLTHLRPQGLNAICQLWQGCHWVKLDLGGLSIGRTLPQRSCDELVTVSSLFK